MDQWRESLAKGFPQDWYWSMDGSSQSWHLPCESACFSLPLPWSMREVSTAKLRLLQDKWEAAWGPGRLVLERPKQGSGGWSRGDETYEPLSAVIPGRLRREQSLSERNSRRAKILLKF